MTVKIVSPNNLERFAQRTDEKFAKTSHTHDTASLSVNGFMSSTDKVRLASLDTVITLPKISYTTLPSKSTDASTYFKEWLIYCIANYGSIMRSGKVIICPVNPNSEGTCIGWCYTDSEVDSNGLPRYSTFIYIPLGNTTHYRFGTNNYTFYYAAGDTNTTYSSKTAANGGTDVSLVTTGEKYTWNNKLDKTTYNYNKELAIGSSGYVLIGKFPCYDSNVTIHINSTTSTTYHATAILATQNINTSAGGSINWICYDPLNNVTNNLFVKYVSGSNVIEIYFKPESWSKNLVQVQCVALASAPTNILETVSSIPAEATRKPTNAYGSSPKFTDTTYSSKAAANGGTDVSLVTTGEKYTWNSKANGNHTHTTLVTTGDHRNDATTPASYANNLIFQGLKTNSKIGSPSSDTYSYLIGLKGWSDSSGGLGHELAFNNSGIKHRIGTSDSAWGAWESLLTSNSTLSAAKLSGLTKAQITTALGYTPPTTNTTYESMSQAEATTGTETTARSISAKVLHTKVESMISDAEPIVQESVLSSALNANTAFTVPNHTVGSKKNACIL